jgi:hypothetical protein
VDDPTPGYEISAVMHPRRTLAAQKNRLVQKAQPHPGRFPHVSDMRQL